jgi:hypothetical protein
MASNGIYFGPKLCDGIEIMGIYCKIYKTHGVLLKMNLHTISKLMEFKFYNIIIKHNKHGNC